MSHRPSTPFREYLQVSSERIKALDDVDLNSLTAELLRAHAYLCIGSASEVRTNAEIKAPDGGCDGWTPRPPKVDPWFGSTETCWQFKAGQAGQPKGLCGEVTKEIPRQTLLAGGRFVLVASGCTSGSAGEERRRKVLQDEAKVANLPYDRIDVIGADRLTNWCNEHPAVAAPWAGRSTALMRLVEWAQMDVHQAAWQSTSQVDAALTTLRRELDLADGSTMHLHIPGPPGVGKTRLALELCRGAAWSGSVIYLGNGSDFKLPEIIRSAVREPQVRLMLVADEMGAEQLPQLRDALHGSEGRVRLVTIGHTESDDPRRIPNLPVRPMDAERMRGVVGEWYPAMPREYVDFVIQFSDGFIKLARLAADAVAGDRAIDVRQLLRLRGIQSFLDKMLGTQDRQHLYVVAVLSSVGWTEDVKCEGEAIAQHFGWGWNDVRASVERFHRQFGIAPRGGRYRYISPKPLATYLAVEAWETYPDELKKLVDVLPTESSKEAYYERLKAISTNPHARQFSADQLTRFFLIEHFMDERAVSKWASFAPADPVLAAQSMAHTLAQQSVETRLAIQGKARRTAIWTLVRLAWNPAAFHHAVLALALLAEAENETWGNNASGEFKDRFLVDLGGTSLNYVNRLTVIDDLVKVGRVDLLRLAVSALAQVGNHHAYRSEISHFEGRPRAPEWQPASGQERLKCVEEALTRLAKIASESSAELLPELTAAADQLSMLLRPPTTRPLVLRYYETLRKAHPRARESIRRVIESIIHREKSIWNELPASDISVLEAAHASFECFSLSSRLQQFIGQATYLREEQANLESIADELRNDPKLLAEHWGWLTSGDAADGWRLGQTFGLLDRTGDLEHFLSGLPNRGPDLRLLSGYVAARLRERDRSWLDAWLTEEMRRRPQDVQLLFEIASRVTATDTVARLVTSALDPDEVVERKFGQIAYGDWSSNVSIEVLRELLLKVSGKDDEQTAITILFQRLKHRPDEADDWLQFAEVLVTQPRLVQSRNTMVNHYWENVARLVAKKNPGAIAKAILRAHANRATGWMAEISGAKSILFEVADLDPPKVWSALQERLEPRASAAIFVVGFPRGIVDRLPRDSVLEWISKSPAERAPIIAHLASKDFANDDSLAAQVIEKHGGIESVASSFFSNLISGLIRGNSSQHWENLAAKLAEVSSHTRLPQLRLWADGAIDSLRKMAEHDRRREDEEQVRSS